MKLRHLILTVSLGALSVAACGGSAKNDDDKQPSQPPASSSEGKEEVCEEYCTQLSACDGSSVEDCTETCTEGELTSRGGQEVLTECFDEDVCNLDELSGLAALGCVIDELDDLELSEEAETYCSESVDKINNCLDAEPPEQTFGSCEDTIGLASDELLAELNECATKDCEDIETCIFLELIGALPAEVISGDTDELSPALLADFLAIGVVFGQLGLSDEGFEDPFNPDPDPGAGAGGAAN